MLKKLSALLLAALILSCSTPAGAAGGAFPPGQDNQTADEVPATPSGNLECTNVQTCIDELEDEKAPTVHTHDAADITSGLGDIVGINLNQDEETCLDGTGNWRDCGTLAGAQSIWISQNTLGTAADIVSDTTISITTTAIVEVEHVIIFTAALDNIATPGATAATTTNCDVTGPVGVTFARAVEAAAGTVSGDWSQAGIYYAEATQEIAAGSTLTLTCSSAVLAKSVAAWEFSVNGTGLSLSVSGTDIQADSSVLDPTDVSIAGLSSGPYLFVHAAAIERQNTGTTTHDTDYTAMATNIGSSGTVGSTEHQELNSSFRALTGTGDSNSFTFGNTARDLVQVYAAIRAIVQTAGLDVGAPPPVTGDVFYVATNGSGTLCTSAAPCTKAQAESCSLNNTCGATGGTGDDIINFKAGTYDENGDCDGANGAGNCFGIQIGLSGAGVGDEITYQADPAAAPLSVIAGSSRYCIGSFGKSHVIIRGFNVPGRCGNTGIAIAAEQIDETAGIATNVQVIGNRVRDTDQPCIGVGGQMPLGDTFSVNSRMEDVLLQDNDVAQCNREVPFVSVGADCHGANGTPGNESISVGNNVDGIEVLSNDVAGPCQYGIDFKKGVRNGRIAFNTVTNHDRHCLYLDANSTFFVQNIIIEKNFCDGARTGVMMIREFSAVGGDISNIIVRNNLLTNITRSCIKMEKHSGDANNEGTGSNFDIFNNDCWKTGTGSETDYAFEVEMTNITGLCRWRNNVTYQHSDRINGVAGEFDGGTCAGSNNLLDTANPLWTNASGNDFSFPINSPLFNQGTNSGAPTEDYDGNPRPACGATDIGAIERQTCS